MAKGSGTTRSVGSSSAVSSRVPTDYRGGLSGIPSSEQKATQGWLDMVERAETVDRLFDISSTAKSSIMAQGKVSFESVRAVVQAAEGKIAKNIEKEIRSATTTEALREYQYIVQTLRGDRIISELSEREMQTKIRRKIASLG